MERVNAYRVSIVVAILGLLVMACNPGMSPMPNQNSATADALGFVDASGTVSATSSVDLLAGQTIKAGTVTLGLDQENLILSFATVSGWKLEEIHLSVGIGFSSIPTNKAGNPVVGSFPYKATGLDGLESYVFSIPLASLGAQAGTAVTIAAHAVVYRAAADGSIQRETAWGEGSRITAKGSWAMFFTIVLGEMADIVTEFTTETAFAYGGQYAIEFELFDVANRWGWTNGPLIVGTYVFDIYAGAGRSDISKGTKVGKLTVVYNGSRAEVRYDMSGGFMMTETHLYVGNAELPSFKGEPTVAPGQYPNKHGSLADVASDSFIINNLSGSIYVVAHAVVKGVF